METINFIIIGYILTAAIYAACYAIKKVKKSYKGFLFGDNYVNKIETDIHKITNIKLDIDPPSPPTETTNGIMIVRYKIK